MIPWLVQLQREPMEATMPEEPIEAVHRERMGAVADVLCDVFQGYGFALLVFNFNDGGGRFNYISNADRQDMLVAMKEFISRNEFGDQDSEARQ